MIDGKSTLQGSLDRRVVTRALTRKAPGACFRRQFVDLLIVAALMPLIAVGAADDDAPSPSDHWDVIDAYTGAIQAHWAKRSEIHKADISAEEKERLLQDLGPVPDAAPAAASAMAIIESNGERLMDAADFLLNRARPPEQMQQLALDAVAAQIGPDWSLVQDYVKSQSAFLEAANKRDGTAGQRLQQGVELPTWHAVAAARAIIQSNHERALEAAEFLMQQTYSLRPGNSAMLLSSWWLSLSMDFGDATLVELIGPDWKVIQDYVAESKSWQAAEQEIRAADLDEEEMARLLRELGDAPKVYRATAAALAIVNAEGTHEKIREAAEFLLDNPTRGGMEKGLRGAKTLAAHFPDYDQWPLRLKQVNSMSSVFGPGKTFITDLVESLEDPLAQATARYFAASYLIQSANNPQIDVEERIAQQDKAEELATGLSAGIENETFVMTKQGADGTEVPMTYADAEAELLYSLDSTMVGSVVSDVRARRVDGTEDSLAAYAGRVVLVDFWATWCGPCLEAFPKLRELVDKLPKERFQIIGVSVDEELDTVTDYLTDNPLQWVVWHVGDESEIVRRWRVTGFPTYVLIGPDGTIINKYPGVFNAEFKAEIEQAVQDAGALVAGRSASP